jgi:hypothetical protein
VEAEAPDAEDEDEVEGEEEGDRHPLAGLFFEALGMVAIAVNALTFLARRGEVWLLTTLARRW